MKARIATAVGIPLLIVAGAALGGMVVAQVGGSETQVAESIEHPKVPFPATLTGERAESVYHAIKDQIRQNYARSGDPVVLGYQAWNRFNTTPYRSPNHGRRFVNHYGNDKARAYGRFENMGPLPTGAIVIKDSFVVTESGQVRTGPLFMMEKMASGFKSTAGTWRFMMLRPDGAIMGMTGGSGADAVEFCAKCHQKAGPEHDYLFFMPDESRIKR